MNGHDGDGEYPPGAYAPDGVLWWKLVTAPGTKQRFGGEQKIAAWLFFNRSVGGTFTMRDLREALGAGDEPNADEHLNRRMRKLRQNGWVIDSYRSSGSLAVDTYRIQEKGWHPGAGPRPKQAAISKPVRRKVMARDLNRCVLCGVGSNEPYPGEPGSKAVMTIGHRVPGERDGRTRTVDELQTECQHCNEPVRDEMPDPPTLAEVRAEVKPLNRAERAELASWLKSGYRHRRRVDTVYDHVRLLSPDERTQIAADLAR